MARKQPSSRGGRPSRFDQETAEAICRRLIAGESLRTICADDEMPCAATVFNWLRRHPAFLDQYTRAREAQADALVEDILEIADDARNDWMERRGDEDAGWVANGEHIQRSKLRIETRKWLMSKLAPKKYGERLQVEADVTNVSYVVSGEPVEDIEGWAAEHAAH